MKKTILLALVTIMSTVTGARADMLTGAGATFPAPVYAKWAEAAKTATGIELNYQAIGSGGGQNQIFNRTVDFGASDAPVSADKLSSNNLLQVPTVMGAVVVIVNLPGVENNQLRLNQSTISGIYLGKIKDWGDPAIAKDNPNLKLPKLAIAPVYRADGSGTTFVWTSYLSKINSDWQSSVGANTSVKWPTGTGAKGNDGVSAVVKQVKGAIGYVESVYASQNKLVVTQLQTADGHWVTASNETYSAAAKNADWKNAPNFTVDLLNQPGDKSWPIVSATFILVPTNATDAAKTKLIATWLGWAYANGNSIAQNLDYIPLPVSVQEQALQKIKGLIK